MARQRKIFPLSYDPENEDTAEVLKALEDIKRGQRSPMIWHWCAEYLRGKAMAVEAVIEEPTEMSDDEMDLVADRLADL